MKEKPSLARFRWPRLEMRGSNGLGAVLLLGLLSAFLFLPYVQYFETRDIPERSLSRFPGVSILRRLKLPGSSLVKDWELPGAATLEGMEYWFYDTFFRNIEDQQPQLREKIAIIAIDQNSLNNVGVWPWPRALHARVINRLHKAGASVIGLDVDFSDRSNPGPHGELSKDDKALVDAVAAAKNVVLPADFTSSGYNLLQSKSHASGTRTYNLTTPFGEDEHGHEGLDEQTPDLALNYEPTDTEGGHRRYPLVGRLSGVQVGSFAALIAAVYQKMSMGDDSSAYETALKSREWFSLKNGAFDIPTRTAQFPGAESPQFQEFLLKYRMSRVFPTYSYSDVLNQDGKEFDDAQMKKLFGGKIVLIGATAPILKDIFPGANGEDISGVELHAGAICQLLEGTYLEPPVERTTIIDLFGMALISSLWPQLVRGRISRISRRAQERWKARKYFKSLRFRVQDPLWFFLTGTLALLPVLCFRVLCQFSFERNDIWTVITYPLLASLFSAALATVYLFTLETAERRKVMKQIGLYLDPDIMETILAHPEEDYPRPRRTTATVMFTDLQGFTSYSESHSADDVVTALNAYMSRLQPIIKKHHGVVDKYIGDAIMSYFGVPVPRVDHAMWALNCAIEIQEECALFRSETGIPFYTRIGIHTGELIAGSIGSQHTTGSLVNYTVIGDTVNLASRLEAKNKDFDSWILCSKVTLEAAPDVANAAPVRDKIKGLSQEVEMFVVHGRAGQAPRDEVWGAEMPTITAKPPSAEI